MADHEGGNLLSIYEENGYKDRADYLHSLASEYGMDILLVITLADILGENEDFDGLISALEESI